jgi:hypothetical protein
MKVDIRIRSIMQVEGLHLQKCGTNVALGVSEQKACGQPANFRIDNLRAEKRGDGSVGYVCSQHIGNVFEWLLAEDD